MNLLCIINVTIDQRKLRFRIFLRDKCTRMNYTFKEFNLEKVSSINHSLAVANFSGRFAWSTRGFHSAEMVDSK